MRAVFYTQEEIRRSFEQWNPQLHRYATDCRAARPIPVRSQLTAADEAKLEILIHVVTEVRGKRTIYRAPRTRIVHGGELTLLAFQEVFGNEKTQWLALLSEEWIHWREDVFSGADDWLAPNWITFHDAIPKVIQKFIDATFEIPCEFHRWLLTVASDTRASHELWVWDERSASSLGVIMTQVNEDSEVDSLPLDGWVWGRSP
jgi:hypothetical protein